MKNKIISKYDYFMKLAHNTIEQLQNEWIYNSYSLNYKKILKFFSPFNVVFVLYFGFPWWTNVLKYFGIPKIYIESKMNTGNN